ncbi:TonB-linked SusC/RagA family outer membrane protein [Dyadobacter jejuensis]|uniref:TonB-linked SusC/RagA family outer membrane protein n=1 Tax=Dyadobacter jejuensis TaxID=1082580 RepID=A0A316ABJ8_9BACT|nr:TonB-dependent receptor [Dyadobacter jejuensis]PWJ55001.1 TonB-linked SusC/RagA family outer membrane protein [Dyadobacter jejuensis]
MRITITDYAPKTIGLFIVFLCCLAGSVLGQGHLVKGKVKSADGEGIPGASIIVRGTQNGTTTDVNGDFQLKAPAKGVLIVSFVGFVSQAVNIEGKAILEVTLLEDAVELQEVVAVGYGTQKKKEVTGAVVQVDNETLNKSSTSDLGTALQGQIAGVSVQSSSGAPGSEANIQIRGVNSITGQNQPLYVVDGIPYNGDPKLSISEIASIDVLKDAASASIYGTRGSGGVILITTKQGKAGTMQVSLDGYYGVQNITSGVPRMNFEQYMYAFFLNSRTMNGTNMGSAYTPLETNPYQFYNDTDVSTVVEQNLAPIQNYSLNVRGGTKDLSYSVNANYFGQKGMIINSDYNRLNIRANTGFTKNKWTIRTSIGLRDEDRSNAAYGLLTQAYSYKPYMQAVDPSKDVLSNGGGPGSSDIFNLGTIIRSLQQKNNDKGGQYNGNLQIEYQLSKDLKLMTRVGGSNTFGNQVIISPLLQTYDDLGVLQTSASRSSVYNSSSRATSFIWENTLNYTKNFGEHHINAFAGFTMESYTRTSFFAQKYDLVDNSITVLNGATLDPNVGSGTGYNQNMVNKLMGTLGRLQYNFKGKYLFSVSARRDGSSRFSDEYRWGIFPSFSAGWNVSDEAFFKPLLGKIDVLRIRATHGTTGNQNFLDYSNAATISLGKDYVFGRNGSDNLVLGYTQTSFANANVKWETSVQTNLGIDMAFFNNKFTFTADLYNTNKRDMLFPLLVPPSTGGGNNSTVILNVGDMNNKGVELAAGYRQSGAFSWSTNATFTKNINKIVKMSGNNKTNYLTGGSVDGVDRVTVIQEGLVAGAFMVMPTDGVVKTEAQLEAYRNLVPTAQMGDLIYLDKKTIDTDGDGVPDKGDGILNDDDRVFAGSGTPKFEIGYNVNASYKNFDVSMQWYSAYGGKVINGSRIAAYQNGTAKDLLYQNTPDNPNSDIPTNRGSKYLNYRGWSDYWIEDGSFIRLRNVSLGYTLPKALANKIKTKSLRVYLAAQNPLTITKYTGFDPEVGGDGLQSRGIDRGNYPMSSQYRVGFELNF